MNKTKKTLAYLGGIAFTILGIWLLTMDTPPQQPILFGR